MARGTGGRRGGDPGRRDEESALVPPLVRYGVNAAIVGLVVLFFAAVHLVFPADDPTTIRLVRKDSLSFERTFVGLDAFVNDYNSASDEAQARIEQEPLYGKLLAAGFVREARER